MSTFENELFVWKKDVVVKFCLVFLGDGWWLLSRKAFHKFIHIFLIFLLFSFTKKQRAVQWLDLMRGLSKTIFLSGSLLLYLPVKGFPYAKDNVCLIICFQFFYLILSIPSIFFQIHILYSILRGLLTVVYLSIKE